jgi:hypothetical protein
MTAKKGTQRELYIAHKFGKLGYRTMRSYASLGSFDFIAFKRASANNDIHLTNMLLIQVKGDPYGFSEENKQLLLKDAEDAGARPVLVYRETRKKKLGLTKKGKQRTQARWETVYL